MYSYKIVNINNCHVMRYFYIFYIGCFWKAGKRFARVPERGVCVGLCLCTNGIQEPQVKIGIFLQFLGHIWFYTVAEKDM